MAASVACSTKAADDTGIAEEPRDNGDDVTSENDDASEDDTSDAEPSTSSDTPPSSDVDPSDIDPSEVETGDVESGDVGPSVDPSDVDLSDTDPTSERDDGREVDDSAATNVTDNSSDDVTDDSSDDVTVPPDNSAMPDPLPPRVPLQHRASAETCDNERPPGDVPPQFADAGLSSDDECYSDADCSEGANGRCNIQRDGAFCSYDRCFEDTECSSGPCSCGRGGWAGANSCLSGNCQVDADCGAGGYCSPTFSDCGNYLGVVGYYCHTLDDLCIDDADCYDPGMGAGYCAFFPQVGYWSCGYGQCVG